MCLGGIAVTAALMAAAPAQADRTGRVVALVKPGTDPHVVATAAGAKLDGPHVPQIGLITLRPPRGTTVGESARRTTRVPGVITATPEHDFQLRRFTPSDPALRVLEPDGSAPEGTSLQWPLERSNLFKAWAITRGDDARVAILDTGIDGTHPDFAGKIAGAVDLDETSADPATVDTDGHGTHVASLACAATDNGIGIAGTGANCKLFVIKTDLTDASVAAGIVAAADARVHALNMSFGDDGRSPSPVLQAAVRYALARNVVMVAAAADEAVEEQGEPANLLQPAGTGADAGAGSGLSVTAATIEDRRASFAGHGSQVSLAAYGALRADDAVRGIFGLYPQAETPREGPSIFPPSPGCGCRASFDGDARYAFLPGTSMSAPQVAAVAALMRDLNPRLSALDVVRILKATARRPPGGSWGPELGWGILDGGAAVAAAQRADLTPPISQVTMSERRGRRTLVRWHGEDPAVADLLPSGIVRYQLYRAIDDGPARRVASTRGRRRALRLAPGHRYSFWTVAIDAAGNREEAPAQPDLVVRR